MVTEEPDSILCVMRALDVGGVERLYTDLLGRLAQDGRRVAIAARPGPLSESAHEAGIETVDVEWGDGPAATYEAVAEVAGRYAATLVVCDPATFHVLPGVLAAGGTTLLAVHARSVALLGQWFARYERGGRGEDVGVRDLRLLGRALAESDAGGVLTISEQHRRELGALLDVDNESLLVLPSSVDTDSIEFCPDSESGDVLVLTRLDRDVASHLRAGVELVSSRQAAGSGCHLHVVGDGDWREEAGVVCRDALLEGSYHFHGGTLDPMSAIRRAHVVVGAGVTALEAAAAGRRVATVRRGGEGGDALGPCLTPEIFPALAASNFASNGSEPASADAVWRDLEALTPAALARIRELVESNHSSRQVAFALAQNLDALRARDSDAVLAAVGLIAAGGVAGERRTMRDLRLLDRRHRKTLRRAERAATRSSERLGEVQGSVGWRVLTAAGRLASRVRPRADRVERSR